MGRPASTTRSIRHRASSRFFCSRSIPSGIQSFLYLCDLLADFFAHRIELGIERSAKPDPVFPAHVFERQIHAQFNQLLFEIVDAARVALPLIVAPLQEPLNRAR